MSFERLEKISLHSDYYVVQMDWTMRDPDYFLDLNTESQKILFLVGVFEENPDRFFFVSSTRSVHFLCIMHFYHMYLVFHFQRIQNL